MLGGGRNDLKFCLTKDLRDRHIFFRDSRPFPLLSPPKMGPRFWNTTFFTGQNLDEVEVFIKGDDWFLND